MGDVCLKAHRNTWPQIDREVICDSQNADTVGDVCLKAHRKTLPQIDRDGTCDSQNAGTVSGNDTTTSHRMLILTQHLSRDITSDDRWTPMMFGFRGNLAVQRDIA